MGLLENINKYEKFNDKMRAIEDRITEEYSAEIAELERKYNEALMRRSHEIQKAWGVFPQAMDKLKAEIEAEMMEHKSSVKTGSGRLNVVYTKGRVTIDAKKVKEILNEEQIKAVTKVGKPSVSFRWKND